MDINNLGILWWIICSQEIKHLILADSAKAHLKLGTFRVNLSPLNELIAFLLKNCLTWPYVLLTQEIWSDQTLSFAWYCLLGQILGVEGKHREVWGSYRTGESLHTAGIVRVFELTITPYSPSCSAVGTGPGISFLNKQTESSTGSPAGQGCAVMGPSCQLEMGKPGWEWDSLHCPELLQESWGNVSVSVRLREERQQLLICSGN